VFFSKSAQTWPTEICLEADFTRWELHSSVVFFDIDDTLAAHGDGLNAKLVEQLNFWVEQGKRVILLTNCSLRRQAEHQRRSDKWQGRFEIWPVGKKPNLTWMSEKMLKENILPKDCSMYGDRPTMDIWMAYQLGFKHRVWVQAWGRDRERKGALGWIQNQEWKWMNQNS
jgi:ribonucleotide monophosphatase NagD (HAD superfamily)